MNKVLATAKTEIVLKRWDNSACVVAATGPSLTPEVSNLCRGQHVIAVNDAYRLFPDAEILYACDKDWWDVHEGCPGFAGEKWSSHQQRTNNKAEAQEKYGLRLVLGRHEDGFCFDPKYIHYGNTSSFQAINLAIHFGATRIILVGFDMRDTTPRHFFGDHPQGLKNGAKFSYFIPAFDKAARQLPEKIKVINCTPGSALKCFPMMELADVCYATRT